MDYQIPSSYVMLPWLEPLPLLVLNPLVFLIIITYYTDFGICWSKTGDGNGMSLPPLEI